ncbi:MAG: hypothetical protein QXG00_05800 [Candidatus Woesearchaeota archaeon]
MNDIEKLIDDIKNDLINLREIFDYYMDSYGIPENYKNIDYDKLIKKIELLRNVNYFDADKKMEFEESKALNELVYLFLLDSISSIEEDINNINIKKRNFINIKEKIKKFRKKVINEK